MTDMLIDHTYIEALIDKNNEKHEIAEKISDSLHRHRLYLPNHELIILINNNKVFITQSKKLFEILNDTTRIDYTSTKKIFTESYKKLNTENKLNFTENLTVGYMKEKNLKYILSFNEKYDEIQEISRISKATKKYKY